jgi:hypothetical protein
MNSTDIVAPLTGALSKVGVAPQSRRVVVVLGMHRTGTSLCTSVLSRLGVALSDDLLPPGPDNEQGFFESARILNIHQDILAAIGAKAADSLTIRPRPPQWWTMPALSAAKEALRDLIVSESSGPGKLWGFKDPRTAVLLPIWQEVFTAAGMQPVYLLTLRYPWEVAASLKKRNRISEKLSELLWLEHYLEAIRFAAADIAMVVPYDKWFTEPLDQAIAIAAVIGRVPAGGGPDAKNTLANIAIEIVDPDLRHHVDREGTFAYDISRVFYEWLELGELDDAADMIARVEVELPVIARGIREQHHNSSGREG